MLQTTLSNQKALLGQIAGDCPPPTAPKPNVMRSNSEPCSKIRSKSSLGVEEQNELDNLTNKLNGLQVKLMPSMSNTSLSSIDSQESVIDIKTGQRRNRQQRLEERHQELLKKQKLLQEQYTKLQQLSRGELPKNMLFNDLKKTASDSNINVGEPKLSRTTERNEGNCSNVGTPMNGNTSNETNGKEKKKIISNGDMNTSLEESSTSNMISPNTQKLFRTDLL